MNVACCVIQWHNKWQSINIHNILSDIAPQTASLAASYHWEAFL